MVIKQINESVSFLSSKGIGGADTGIVLGTGLSKLIDHINIICAVPYEDIPHFPIATVEFHSGKLIYGELEGKRILAMNGRFHYYEGYNMREITFPIRVMKAMGIQQLLLSNAAGCMNLEWEKGDLMLIDDHINLLPDNPLFGKNAEEFGPRFPDMSRPYDPTINQQLKKIAKQQDVQLREGVYVAVGGPNLETRAEYKFLRMIGGDAVGMSTVPEVIVARHMNLPCAAISVLTDMCDPNHLEEINIDDIIETAGKAEDKLLLLLKELLSHQNSLTIS